MKFEMYCETTIYVSFSLYIYLFAKTKLKLILFLYVTFICFKFIPWSPIKCSGSILITNILFECFYGIMQ